MSMWPLNRFGVLLGRSGDGLVCNPLIWQRNPAPSISGLCLGLNKEGKTAPDPGGAVTPHTNENSPRKPKPGPGLTLEKGASKRRKPYNPKDPPHL